MSLFGSWGPSSLFQLGVGILVIAAVVIGGGVTAALRTGPTCGVLPCGFPGLGSFAGLLLVEGLSIFALGLAAIVWGSRRRPTAGG